MPVINGLPSSKNRMIFCKSCVLVSEVIEDRLSDFCLWQSKPDTVECNLSPQICGSEVGQNYHQESNLLNLMVKSVDKVRRIRYNLYGI